MKWLISILLISIQSYSMAQNNQFYFVEGQVTNPNNKAVKDASIQILTINKTIKTNKFGKFIFSLKTGNYLAMFSAEDFVTKEVLIEIKNYDTVLNVILQSKFNGITLDEVAVKGRSSDKLNSLGLGTEQIDRNTVDKIPALLGERDPLKALQLLPGIVATTEGSAEINVRGGSNDQNLITLDQIPLYSSTHLFGLFSAFNPLAISKTTIYKGDFPANMGGRLSSVTNLVTTDTIAKQFNGTVEMGITSAKTTIAIPMLHQKATLYLAGRRSYYDLLFKVFGKGSADIFAFQDYNLGWVYAPNFKNKIKLTIYQEQDAVGTQNTNVQAVKANATKSQSAFGLNWKHSFNNTLSNEAVLYFNNFNNRLSEEKSTDGNAYQYNFKTAVEDVGFNNTINYNSGKHNYFAGINLVRHNFKPSRFSGEENNITFDIINIASTYATNLSFFAGMQSDFIWGGKLNLGFRNNNYFVGLDRYISFEPRLAYLQPITSSTALKFAYAKMTQPVNRLTNSGLGLPQDIIISAGNGLRPQQANHFSVELVKNFEFDKEQFTFSLQPFYKKLENIISFNDGYDTRSIMYSNTFKAKNIAELITTGNNNSYGLEMMLEKRTGTFNGWVSYTVLKATDKFAALNNGIAFSPAQDRRHNLNIIANWQATKKWNVGFSWMYISGQPINVPENVFLFSNPNYLTGSFTSDTKEQYLFEQGFRGGYRMKPFHKLDISAIYKFRVAGMAAVWNISAYNIYNRQNSSFYYIGKSDAINQQIPQPVLKSVSLFPFIPSSSLSISF